MAYFLPWFETIQGFPGVLIVVGHLLDTFLLEVNFISWKLDSKGCLFGQASWKFVLVLSNKGAIESNSHYMKFISHMKESIKCPTAMKTVLRLFKKSMRLV